MDIEKPSEAKKWSVALGWAAILTSASAVYVGIAFGDVLSLMSWSFIMAAVASLLYATAFVSGSMSYYIGWPNMRLGYQKQIGLLGFWFSLAYCITLLILYPDTYYYGFFDNLLTADFIFGISAMAIFTAMTVINSKPIAPYFSWDTIKFVLGLGFVGYAFLVIRAIFIEFDLWWYWITTFEGYPPGRLVLSVIAVAILLLRISIPIHKKLTQKQDS